jgi:hypothetical protein
VFKSVSTKPVVEWTFTPQHGRLLSIGTGGSRVKMIGAWRERLAQSLSDQEAVNTGPAEIWDIQARRLAPFAEHNHASNVRQDPLRGCRLRAF